MDIRFCYSERLDHIRLHVRIAGLVIGNCQDMDRIDVQLTFISDVFQIKLASI